MRCFSNKLIQEKYYVEKLDNGLTVCLMPKNDFHKTYAIFSTKYGSRDVEFVPLGKDEFIKTPEGIAHFLEHKLFENEDGTDASNIFATQGADVNAFTTNNQTAYLFSTTSDLEANVKLLLDFVQSPCFTRDGIEKERGIIEQELLMYLDQPQNIQYYGILKGLYKTNNIRNEIGGTTASIQEINEDLLYTCYQTFYHPSNMVLAIVGNFDLNQMLNLIVENQKQKEFAPPFEIKRKYLKEDLTVNEKHSFVDMDIAIPKVSLGLKLPLDDLTSYELLKRFSALEILIDIYLDDSSLYYEQLMQQNIINNSFEYALYYDTTYGHLLINIDTNTPDLFIDKMKELIKEIHEKAIDEKDFLRIKKLYQSRGIRRFNSLEYTANSMVEAIFDQLTLFDSLEVIDNLTLDDVIDARKYFLEERIATFTIFPKKQKVHKN